VQIPPLHADHWLYSEHSREQSHQAIDGLDGLLVLAHFFEMRRRRTELLGYDCARLIWVLQVWLLLLQASLLVVVMMMLMMMLMMMMLMMVLQSGSGMRSSRLLQMSMQR